MATFTNSGTYILVKPFNMIVLFEKFWIKLLLNRFIYCKNFRNIFRYFWQQWNIDTSLAVQYDCVINILFNFNYFLIGSSTPMRAADQHGTTPSSSCCHASAWLLDWGTCGGSPTSPQHTVVVRIKMQYLQIKLILNFSFL